MVTKRTKKTLGRVAVGITILVVVAVGLLGYNAAAGSRNNADHYRTVIAGAGTVTQSIALSGIVHHVTQASMSFPVSGMVTAVNVKPGDSVTAGQALASIDAGPLQNAVLAANATYAQAVSQYETDQQTYASSTASTTKAAAAAASTSRTSAAGGSSQGSTAGSSGSGSASGGPGGGGAGGAGDPAAAVKAATDALAALETGVKGISAALPVFVSECVPLIPTTTAAPEATVTKTVTATATVTHTVTVSVTAAGSVASSSSASSSASTASSSASSKATSSSSATASASGSFTNACQAAIATLTAAEATLPDQMTAANVTLSAAVKALNAQAAALQQESAALAKQQQAAQAAAAAAQAAAAKQQAAAMSSSNSALQAAAAAGLSRSGGGGTVTEATLITDQAAIQTASIALAQAKDQLAQATLTSPIAGKVASMPFVVGQQASATATAVVIGSGAIEVTVAVPLASRPLVTTGETAKVTSVVGGTTLEGTISRISLLPTTTAFSLAAGAAASGGGASSTSSSSTTTYATVITVPTGGDALPEGSRVQTTITTKSVDAAVVVPASAVTPLTSGSGTVQVITNGVLSTKRVVTGVVGSTDVQIVSGLTPGETVVIADVTKPIAGASIAASRGGQNAQQFPNGRNETAGSNATAGGNAGGTSTGAGGVEPPAGGAPPS